MVNRKRFQTVRSGRLPRVIPAAAILLFAFPIVQSSILCSIAFSQPTHSSVHKGSTSVDAPREPASEPASTAPPASRSIFAANEENSNKIEDDIKRERALDVAYRHTIAKQMMSKWHPKVRGYVAYLLQLAKSGQVIKSDLSASSGDTAAADKAIKECKFPPLPRGLDEITYSIDFKGTRVISIAQYVVKKSKDEPSVQVNLNDSLLEVSERRPGSPPGRGAEIILGDKLSDTITGTLQGTPVTVVTPGETPRTAPLPGAYPSAVAAMPTAAQAQAPNPSGAIQQSNQSASAQTMSDPSDLLLQYRDEIASRIGAHLPTNHDLNTWDVTTTFHIKADGAIADQRLVKSSGSNKVDAAIFHAIDLAAPIKTMPDSARAEFKVRISFNGVKPSLPGASDQSPRCSVELISW